MGSAEELSPDDPTASQNLVGHAENWKQLRRFWHVEIVGVRRAYSWRRLIRRCRHEPKYAFLFWFRLTQLCYRSQNPLLKFWGGILRTRLKRNYAMDINVRAEIGEGLYIAHPIGIAITTKARIGRNCTIFQNVTIGARGSGGDVLRIGDNVSIGAHACIIGNGLNIGDNVAIGAASFVNQDIPSGATLTNIREPRIRIRSDEAFPMIQKNVRSNP